MRGYEKNLYIIGGTMGVGKTAVSHQLKSNLLNSVFLDGDWCWDANPFHVTNETKASVERIPMYKILNTIKIDTNEKSVSMITNEIEQL